ncbi:CBO0543 family protein [Sporomusa aerivorans]|uniref:CBO0543 family protein n=1 Tax=Sporomusa aerivorans TaxID=204936 RepID=UPI00352B6794
MNKDDWSIAALIAGSLLLLIVLGRKDRLRESVFAFSVAQSLNWPLTILLVYWGKLESPVRLFAKATDSNFMFSFVFLPSVFVIYYLYYPRAKGPSLQLAFTLLAAGGIALVHVAIQEYTNLIKYISFSGYKLWLIGILSFYITRVYIDWYFRQLTKKGTGGPQ